MISRNTFLAFALASAMAALGGGADAAGIKIGPEGVTIDPGYSDHNNNNYDNHRRHHGISEDEAVSIARHAGVRYVDNVRQRHGDYMVYGTDRHHHDIVVTVDGDNGDVVNVDRS